MITRRKFLKHTFLTSAMSLNIPFILNAKEISLNKLKWDKAICRFCSIGCGILVGTKQNKILDIKPDFSSDINKGILCPKGFENGNILYSKDRLTKPLLKMKNGKYDKDGDFTQINWEEAFNIMEQKAKYALKYSGVDGVGLFTSGEANIYEAYAINKLFRAGFRSNNISNSSSFSTQISSDAHTTIYGTSSQSGTFDDIELTNTIVSWGVNFEETYPILSYRIKEEKNKNKKYTIFNITTIQNKTSKISDVEIFIKPSKDILLLNYILREFIYNNSKLIDWNFLKKHAIFTKLGDISKNKDSDRYEQWEISFYNYKKSLQKYTLEYVSKKLKADPNEDITKFKDKLKLLAKHYIQKDIKILSYWSSGINKQKRGFETNLLLYSLHLILNKHSKKGTGGFNLSGQSSSIASSIKVGTFSNRLPANMYIKYKEHRNKAEAIWNIPNGTLNSVATNNKMQLYDNISNGITKFVWINNSNPYSNIPNNLKYINDLKKKNDLFIVTSDCYGSISASLGDLILPTATHLEKYGMLGNSERKIQMFNQNLLPQGDSMSDLWQVVEFSKRFTINEVWGSSRLQHNLKLKDVRDDTLQFDYYRDSTLYRVLFANKKAKSYKYINNDEILNSEVNGDIRDVKGSEGFVFSGYKFFIQKYLFEEYRMFGYRSGFDLANFDKFQHNIGLVSPYLYNTQIKYLFNTKYDIYASKASKFRDSYIFYGKMGGKKLPFGNLNKITSKEKRSLKYRAKIFTIDYANNMEQKDKTYDILLTSIKLQEQFNSGTLTMRTKNLYNKTIQSYGYINKTTAKSKNLKDDDLCYISSKIGKIKIRIKIDDRFKVPNNTIAVALFDEKVLINKITTDINNTYVNLTKINITKKKV